ncbi:MAG TPA: dihydrodipicolinate synthase family protein [Pyrinomonadaceae bacterium]|nr:dihydrodipicolinate synthase family protein [Pyrinomonadaceae bacterium]
MTNENTERRPGAQSPAPNLRGILLPFPTPFDDSGDFDADALRSNLRRWNETGVGGYVALGSTGERVHLEADEYARVIETARESVPRELLFVAGAGQHGTRASVAEVRQAARAGADAVLLITPHFYRSAMSPDALAAQFEAVADESPVPVVIYSIPQNAGLAVSPETVARLAGHPNVVGLKDSSGDIVNLAETLRLVPEDVSVLTGHGGTIYPALSAGARGGILAVGCAAPRLAVAVQRAFDAGRHESALVMQRRLAPLAKAVTVRYGVGGLKAALDLAGYAGGRVRAPLRMPDEDARREIARLLDAAALTPDEEETFFGAQARESSARAS